ncbi:hypothetical protein F5148DRAFT_1148828 [Russula earlei]|uniref:Uncharacterized protein n=1 Tax=Russula earlei TaxID=71964 RepID=A0ACC0UAK5_9AGAM|nr:hypothetical protein F5148DRAFT_1148828 [Russula earlei]
MKGMKGKEIMKGSEVLKGSLRPGEVVEAVVKGLRCKCVACARACRAHVAGGEGHAVGGEGWKTMKEEVWEPVGCVMSKQDVTVTHSVACCRILDPSERKLV